MNVDLHRASQQDQVKLVTEPQQKAKMINLTKHSMMEKSIKEELKQKCVLDAKVYPLLPNISITTAGVKNLLTNLDPTKASGPDGISPRIDLLKELADEVAPILAIIFRTSLSRSTGHVPEDWRTAFVTPIFKKVSTTTQGSIVPFH